MNTELFIHTGADIDVADSWRSIDLMGDESIPLTFCLADIIDFTKRNASYSKTIKLPGSDSNNILFKNLYDVTVFGSFELNKAYKCYILQNSQVVFQGYFELTNCVVSMQGRVVSYEGLVYSDVAEFFKTENLLRGNVDPLDDLDFSEYDHTLTMANVMNSWNNLGSGILYALIDKTGHWNSTTNQPKFSLDELTPCLFYKEIIDKIFEKYGFSYSSVFFNSERFKRLVYPMTDRYLRHDDDTVKMNSCIVVGNDDVHVHMLKTDPNTVVKKTAFERWHGTVESQGSNNPWSVITDEFTAPYPGYYSWNWKGLFRVWIEAMEAGNVPFIDGYWHNIIAASLNLMKGTSATPLRTLNYFNYNEASTIYLENNEVIMYESDDIEDFGEVYLDAGEKLYVKINLIAHERTASGEPYSWTTQSGIPVNVDVYAGVVDIAERFAYTKLTVELQDRQVDKATIGVTNILHKVRVKDFLSSVNKMFNLYWEPTGPNSFRIEPRDDFYRIDATPVDWTDKFCTAREYKIERASMLEYANAYFSYAEDNDDFNRSYKDSTTEIYGKYDVLTTNKLVDDFECKLIFAPTPGGNVSPNLTMQIPKIYKTNTGGAIDETVEFKPRCLYWAGQKKVKDSSPEWFWVNASYNASNTLYISKYYPYVGHLNDVYGADDFDLNFGACKTLWYDMNGTWSTYRNLYNLYYANMITELKDHDNKLVTCYVALDEKDIRELNFHRPIFIDGVYYRLNKVSNWVPNEITQVELVTTSNIELNFTGKNPRPPFIKYPNKDLLFPEDKYLDLINSNLTPNIKNNEVRIDVFDANYERSEAYDVLDGNTGMSISNNASESSTVIDVVDANEPVGNSITEMKSGVKNTVKRVIFKQNT